jgi:hypothetical protein
MTSFANRMGILSPFFHNKRLTISWSVHSLYLEFDREDEMNRIFIVPSASENKHSINEHASAHGGCFSPLSLVFKKIDSTCSEYSQDELDNINFSLKKKLGSCRVMGTGHSFLASKKLHRLHKPILPFR